MSTQKTFLAVVVFLAFMPITHAQTLNLSTGQARISDENQVILEHVSVGNNYYDATIQLSLDGSYQVKAVEELSLTPTAVYEVTFTSIWSEQTHPHEYPIGLSHFSGLIGASHDASINFWKIGGVATHGIESMAETGAKSLFTTEINEQIETGRAHRLVSGSGIGSSPGVITLQFEVTQQHPFITLVSMLAPSPDWFVGISGVFLIADGQWLDQLVIPLFVYDAGTDSGALYTSPNSDTQPRGTIQRIDADPFYTNGEILSIGTFTFRKIE